MQVNTPHVYATTAPPPLQLTTRLSSKSWVSMVSDSWGFSGLTPSRQLGDEHSDEEDPFAEVKRTYPLAIAPKY